MKICLVEGTYTHTNNHLACYNYCVRNYLFANFCNYSLSKCFFLLNFINRIIVCVFIALGMSQAASDCMLPNVLIRRNFMKFVSDEIDALFPVDCYHRLVAHPPSVTLNVQPVRINNLHTHNGMNNINDNNFSDDIKDDIEIKTQTKTRTQTENNRRNSENIRKKIVVAVGPEGGWEDEEVLLLLSKGFSLVSLGPRILRTDMAVSVLLGLSHDWTDNRPLE